MSKHDKMGVFRLLHDSLQSLVAAKWLINLETLYILKLVQNQHHRTAAPGRRTSAIVPWGEHHSSSMHSKSAPIKPLTDMTAVDVALLAPMFASGSAYVSLAALLLLLLRQVSDAPLLLVTVVVTLPM